MVYDPKYDHEISGKQNVIKFKRKYIFMQNFHSFDLFMFCLRHITSNVCENVATQQTTEEEQDFTKWITKLTLLLNKRNQNRLFTFEKV